jgi:hypothetical protein
MADKKKKGRGVLDDASAYEQLMKVYGAWLGYFLCKLGKGEYRVSVGEISADLDKVSVSAWREGDEYVIRIDPKDVTESDTEEKGN